MSISLMEKLSLAHPDAVYSLVMQYRMNRLGKNLIRTFQTKSIFKNLRTIFMIWANFLKISSFQATSRPPIQNVLLESSRLCQFNRLCAIA